MQCIPCTSIRAHAHAHRNERGYHQNKPVVWGLYIIHVRHELWRWPHTPPRPVLFEHRYHGGVSGEEVETVNKDTFCRFFPARIVICLGKTKRAWIRPSVNHNHTQYSLCVLTFSLTRFCSLKHLVVKSCKGFLCCFLVQNLCRLIITDVSSNPFPVQNLYRLIITDVSSNPFLVQNQCRLWSLLTLVLTPSQYRTSVDYDHYWC